MQQLMPIGQDEVWVEDSEGAGPVVLLLHPGIADSRAWDTIWPALVERCRVIRFDVRALRSLPRRDRRTTPSSTTRWRCSTGSASPARTSSAAAWAAARRWTSRCTTRKRVLSLTLLCPGVNGYDWPDEPELEAEWDALVAADDQEGLFQFGMRLWAAAGPDPVVESLMRDAGEAQANEEQFQRKVEPTFDRLGEIDVPTLMVVGDVDNPTLVEADLAAAQLIPRCRLVTMPGVDHLPMLREPEWTLRLVLDQVGAASVS